MAYLFQKEKQRSRSHWLVYMGNFVVCNIIHAAWVRPRCFTHFPPLFLNNSPMYSRLLLNWGCGMLNAAEYAEEVSRALTLLDEAATRLRESISFGRGDPSPHWYVAKDDVSVWFKNILGCVLYSGVFSLSLFVCVCVSVCVTILPARLHTASSLNGFRVSLINDE